MSSILSEQNLQTLRRRNIGRRWPSLPVAPRALPASPRPPPPPLLPPPKLFLPFIACPPRPCRTDRRDRHRPRRAGLRPAADRPAGRARRGGGATSRCACARVRSTTPCSSSTRTTRWRMTRSLTLRRRSISFISSPRAVDHLEHVGAFLVPADFVGELAPAPVLGLLDAGRPCAGRWPRPACAGRSPALRSRRATRRRRARTSCSYVSFWTYGRCSSAARHLTPPASRRQGVSQFPDAAASGLYAFITLTMSVHGEHLGGIGRPGDERFELGAFVGLELREHVIREIPPRVAAPHPQPQPGKLRGPKPLDDRLEPVVPARRSARPRPQPCRTAAPPRRRPPADPPGAMS